MRKKEAGQAFILVLIILAIGALLVVPALNLSYTELKTSQIVGGKTRKLYAVNAAQEWMLWNLTQPGFGDDFIMGEKNVYPIDVCGTPVIVTIVLQAKEGLGGLTLVTDDVIKPTKTVLPNWVANKANYEYWYTINLEQLSANTTQGLDAIYDLPPGGITDYIGPTQLSLDGGVTWRDVPDPDTSQLVSKGYLKWPANYDLESGDGAFSSNSGDPNYFYGIRDFEVREVKELRFLVRGSLGTGVHCNWVVLKPWNTLSGPQAPIKVGGDPDVPGECVDHSVLEVTKEADPPIILPGVVQRISYSVNITNMYTQTRNINEIRDFLPSGFNYIELISSEMENPTEAIQILELDPLPPLGDPERYNPENDISELNIQGVTRLQLRWRTQKFPLQNEIDIKSGQSLILRFLAETTVEISGSYYNEVIVLLRETGLPPGFSDVGVDITDYVSNYSWNTGTVLVPYYDSRAEADGETIDVNFGITGDGVIISSWQIR